MRLAARSSGLLAGLAVAVSLALWSAAFVLAAPQFPSLTGRVVDDAGVLSAQTRDQLTQILAQRERSSGDQIVVVTLKSLQGYAIEDFGYQLGRYWGIGQKGRDNGAILVVAPKEHKVRIEVGYGLEGQLTDAQSRIIIEQVILPAFRRGDFNAGVLQGTQAILQVLGGQPVAADQAQPLGTWFVVLFVTLWSTIFFGVWGFLIVSFLRHHNDPHWRQVHGNSFWSSAGSSGGSSGGGFSGGGGSFGGGGASGSW